LYCFARAGRIVTQSLRLQRRGRLSRPSFVQPLKQAWLPRLPNQNQRPIPRGRCPRKALDLMPQSTRWKVERWTNRTFSDLRCIRDRGEDCERSRPPPLVISQSELYPWARGIVWDFRQSSRQGGTAFDYAAPLRPTLTKDDHAWDLWVDFSACYGMDPIISPSAAREISFWNFVFGPFSFKDLRNRGPRQGFAP